MCFRLFPVEKSYREKKSFISYVKQYITIDFTGMKLILGLVKHISAAVGKELEEGEKPKNFQIFPNRGRI